MYYYITKHEYFGALDNVEIANVLQKYIHFRLKHIQDACALHKIAQLQAGKVAEIGGGHSRTLPFLYARGWSCWNIEPFEGDGNGPRKPSLSSSIKSVSTYCGAFSPLLEEALFDLVYSISVIEHVPDADLTAFFRDVFRILNPGGHNWHAIDVYLRDEFDPAVTQHSMAVLKAALDAGFTPLASEDVPKAKFNCAFASNPDYVMRQWNVSVPALRSKRDISQSCSLLLGCYK